MYILGSAPAWTVKFAGSISYQYIQTPWTFIIKQYGTQTSLINLDALSKPISLYTQTPALISTEQQRCYSFQREPFEKAHLLKTYNHVFCGQECRNNWRNQRYWTGADQKSTWARSKGDTHCEMNSIESFNLSFVVIQECRHSRHQRYRRCISQAAGQIPQWTNGSLPENRCDWPEKCVAIIPRSSRTIRWHRCCHWKCRNCERKPTGSHDSD